jgi:hypothetical protein
MCAVCSVGVLASPAALGADAILAGNYLRVGVNDSGGLIDGSFTVGIDYDSTGTGTWTGFDFLKPGTPFEFYSVGYSGAPYLGWNSAGYNSGNSFGATTADTSAGAMNSASTTGGVFGPLAISQNLSYADTAGFIDFAVKITNTGGVALTDVVYARGLDPDQDVYANGGYSTNNTIASGDLVYASAPITDWTIGIFSSSPYLHVPSIRADWSSDPYSLLTPTNDGDGDYTINMAFDIGTLAPGQSADIFFQYRIAETGAGVAVPEPTTLLLWSGLGAIGAVMAYRRKRRAP